jgi:hypothetical protein
MILDGARVIMEEMKPPTPKKTGLRTCFGSRVNTPADILTVAVGKALSMSSWIGWQSYLLMTGLRKSLLLVSFEFLFHSG